MTKEDYKEKVEEHRQEIELDDATIRRSRVSRHSKVKKKKQQTPIMKLLVFVFILIPLGILFYVWFLFEPEVPAEVATEGDDKGIVVEIQNQDPKETGTQIVDDSGNVSDKDVAAEEAAKQAAAAEEARKAEEAEKATAAKLEEQKRQAELQARAAEEKRKTEEATKVPVQAASKSHTVQSTDNLYRIALKYYGNGSPEYVNKIKQANGLSSDSISAGQVLIIP